MQLTTQFSRLVPLTLVLLGLVSYNFMSAQWTGPSATAPGSNTSAPINVSSTTQSKLGNFNAYILSAASSTWSPRYCDQVGQNCFRATDVSGAAGTWGTWISVTSSRVANTWYLNNSSNGRMVFYRGGDNAEAYVSINGTIGNQVMVGAHAADSGQRNTGSFIVPPGHYYRLTSILVVSELDLPF